MEKISKLKLDPPPLRKNPNGSLCKTGLLVLSLVEEEPKPCKENVN
jgi:hypothetical protein